MVWGGRCCRQEQRQVRWGLLSETRGLEYGQRGVIQSLQEEILQDLIYTPESPSGAVNALSCYQNVGGASSPRGTSEESPGILLPKPAIENSAELSSALTHTGCHESEPTQEPLVDLPEDAITVWTLRTLEEQALRTGSLGSAPENLYFRQVTYTLFQSHSFMRRR